MAENRLTRTANDAFDAATAQAHERIDRAASGPIAELAHDMTDAATRLGREKVTRVTEAIGDRTHDAATAADDAIAGLGRFIRTNPAALVAAAVAAIGVTIGMTAALTRKR
jgi:ElaB/YqjD/DUF883 family membrane-anchored ribosome-binding protein